MATLTGNPQNMLIGSFSGIPYTIFSKALAPVAVFGLIVCIAILAWIYRDEFRYAPKVEVARREIPIDRFLLGKSLAVSLAMIVFFFLGWPIAKVAIVAGAILLITRTVHPETVYEQVDWSLLVMFAGLFIVIAGVEKSSVRKTLTAIAGAHLDNGAVLSSISAVLSNIVSNVRPCWYSSRLSRTWRTRSLAG